MRAAVRILEDIKLDVRRVSENPLLAPKELLLEEREENFRSVVVRKLFKIVYFFDEDKITVASIWDCRRAPSRLIRLLS